MHNRFSPSAPYTSLKSNARPLRDASDHTSHWTFSTHAIGSTPDASRGDSMSTRWGPMQGSQQPITTLDCRALRVLWLFRARCCFGTSAACLHSCQLLSLYVCLWTYYSIDFQLFKSYSMLTRHENCQGSLSVFLQLTRLLVGASHPPMALITNHTPPNSHGPFMDLRTIHGNSCITATECHLQEALKEMSLKTLLDFSRGQKQEEMFRAALGPELSDTSGNLY